MQYLKQFIEKVCFPEKMIQSRTLSNSFYLKTNLISIRLSDHISPVNNGKLDFDIVQLEGSKDFVLNISNIPMVKSRESIKQTILSFIDVARAKEKATYLELQIIERKLKNASMDFKVTPIAQAIWNSDKGFRKQNETSFWQAISRTPLMDGFPLKHRNELKKAYTDGIKGTQFIQVLVNLNTDREKYLDENKSYTTYFGGVLRYIQNSKLRNKDKRKLEEENSICVQEQKHDEALAFINSFQVENQPCTSQSTNANK